MMKFTLRDIYGPQADQPASATVFRGREVRCVSAEGYPDSLRVGSVYQRVGDPGAEEAGMIRVIDDSGEDYLYPAGMFVSTEAPS